MEEGRDYIWRARAASKVWKPGYFDFGYQDETGDDNMEDASRGKSRTTKSLVRSADA